VTNHLLLGGQGTVRQQAGQPGENQAKGL
jgi:hypothetical protein